MTSSLSIGSSHTARIVVDRARTIDFLGDALRVYATPELVRDIEITCRDLLLAHGAADEDSVGTQIDVAHLAATPEGAWVEITATVSQVEGPLVTCEVTARDAVETVAQGSHQRFCVAVAKLQGKIERKISKLAAV